MRRASDFRTKFIENGFEECRCQQMRNKEDGSEAQLIAGRFRPFSHRVCPFSSISSPSQNVHPLLSLPLSPQRFVARSLVSVVVGGGKEERREREAVAHLNGYPAYRLPCHVSLRRFLGRYNDADTRPEVVWDVVESARKRALPLGGEWVENYLSPAAADT